MMLDDKLCCLRFCYCRFNAILFRDEDEGEFLQTKEILYELGVNNVTIEDCKSVRKICQAVSERAAFLASAGRVH